MIKNKVFLGLICLCILVADGTAQAIIPTEIPADAKQKNFTELKRLYGKNKKLPPGYEYETLLALSHFPELSETYIRFNVAGSYSTAHTRPTWLSTILPKSKRKYTITLSNKTISALEPVTVAHLPFNARIGLIGHEISHVADFSRKSFGQLVKTGIGHLSSNWIDKFEYHTDMVAIQHGLGKELEAWSLYIRHTYHTKNWRGADYVNEPKERKERYMNPDTIEKLIR